jgi:hypothetical protein
MPASSANLFRKAFELAYFIHPHTHVATLIAESALHKLEHSFGRQGRRVVYVPSGRRHGQTTASRALRTKVTLGKEHLLQVLVYAESDQWELSSEQGGGPYRVTQEDMVIRFIKHLVRITVKRNSFYVTLGLGRLLYEYDTSQVRQMYDVLMQDHARFRDNSYLRRQKNLLMREMQARFAQTIRPVRTAQREDRFQSQPTTEPLLRLVRECLVRFTPWDSACVVPEGYDPVGKIPALSFTGSDPDDESPVEINRIHTITDPDCFLRLVTGLGFPAPEKQLSVPQFFFSEDNEPPGDRFNPPALPEENEAQLERSLADRARRRKAFRVGLLSVYVDGVESASFDPLHEAVRFNVLSSTNVIEVRAEDPEGELTLATLVVPVHDIPSEASLIDTVTLEGGQKLTVTLKSVLTPEATEELEVEIAYEETHVLRAVPWLLRRKWLRLSEPETGRDREAWTLRPAWVLGIIGILAVVALLMLWQQRSSREVVPPGPRVEALPTPPPEASPGPTPIKSPERSSSPPLVKEELARATWSGDPTAVDRAIRLELRRGGPPTIEISEVARLLLAVNRVDAGGNRYRRYRITISATDQTIWERTFGAPTSAVNDRAHVLSLELATRKFPAAEYYKLRVDGEAQQVWENLGEIHLKPKGR